MLTKLVMKKFYREADGDPTKLPWHDESTVELLASAVEDKRGGRALDIGCGAGVHAAWLAAHGMLVTGIDMIPDAIAMCRETAGERGVEFDVVCASLFDFEPAARFDLIFDSGCLHSLVGGSVREYRARVTQWLAPGGEYVLTHWGKRHRFDWRPIGPRRRSSETIERLFGRDLDLVATTHRDFRAPLPFGPTVRGSGYRFRVRDAEASASFAVDS